MEEEEEINPVHVDLGASFEYDNVESVLDEAASVDLRISPTYEMVSSEDEKMRASPLVGLQVTEDLWSVPLAEVVARRSPAKDSALGELNEDQLVPPEDDCEGQLCIALKKQKSGGVACISEI
jgi:hypothetical protein